MEDQKKKCGCCDCSDGCNDDACCSDEENGETVELVDDKGKVMKFFHVGTTQFNEKWYAFFMPAEDIEGTSPDEVVIFNIESDEKGEDVLLPVEDEALLEQVYEQFCREMDEEDEAEDAAELDGADKKCKCGCDCDDDCDDDCDCDGEDCNCDDCDCDKD